METVLNALKAMKKASSIEIAARTGVNRDEVVNQLWDFKRRGLVVQHGKVWSLADASGQIAASAEPVKVGEAQIVDVLRQHGPQTSEELAVLLATTSRKIASTLAMPISKGRIKRVNVNGKFRFQLPDAAALSEPGADADAKQQATTEPEPITSVKQVLESITPFAAPRLDDLLLPTVRGVNREIRRAKAKVASLERLRDAVREIGKHKGLIREVLQ